MLQVGLKDAKSMEEWDNVCIVFPIFIHALLRTCATDIFAFTSSRYKFVLELESCKLNIHREVCPVEILSIRLANRRIGRSKNNNCTLSNRVGFHLGILPIRWKNVDRRGVLTVVID